MTNQTVLVTDYPGYSVEESALTAPADSAFLLEVTAAPFSSLDAARLAAGKAAGTLPERFVPGGHIFGKVAQISETAAADFGVAAGDYVYVEPHVICNRCKYCLTGNYSVCEAKLRYGSGTIGGAFSKYLTVVSGSRVHKLPANIPFEHLYYLGLVQTALRAVSKKGLGTLERSLLVGGSSQFALIAAAAGAAMGCTDLTIYHPEQKISSYNGVCVTDKLPAKGFDIVVDAFEKGEHVAALIEKVNPLGRYVFTAGERAAQLPLARLTQNEIEVTGVSGPAWDYEAALLFLRAHKTLLSSIKPTLVPMTDFAAAISASQDALAVGQWN